MRAKVAPSSKPSSKLDCAPNSSGFGLDAEGRRGHRPPRNLFRRTQSRLHQQPAHHGLRSARTCAAAAGYPWPARTTNPARSFQPTRPYRCVCRLDSSRIQSPRTFSSRLQAAEAELAELAAEHARKVERLDLLSFQHDEIQKPIPNPAKPNQVRQTFGCSVQRRKTPGSRSSRIRSTLRIRIFCPVHYRSNPTSRARCRTARCRAFSRLLNSWKPRESRFKTLHTRFETMPIKSMPIHRNSNDVQTRLADLERLHRKYGPDLLEHLQKVRREMDSIGLTETKKEELLGKISALRQEYSQASADLSKKRRTASKKLERAVETELKSLAMPHARFTIAWTDVMPGRASGIDRPSLLISANPGEEPWPVEKIASGGELVARHAGAANGPGGGSRRKKRWFSMKSMPASAEKPPKPSDRS